MTTLRFGELRKGATIELDGQPYEVIDYQRHKMQQRAPVTRLRVRNLMDGKVSDQTFQSYETEFTIADVEARPTQYLYTDGQEYNFMDLQSYEQYPLSAQQLGDNLRYLKEEATVEVSFYKGRPITVKMPIFVELKVTDCPPGFKGDTATGGGKPATLETGATLQVPIFVNIGDTVRVDTRTGNYVERVG